jgi:O-antigen/teichoic acid export membrane protein
MVFLVAVPIVVVNSVVPSTIAEMYAGRRTEELQRVLRLMAALATVPAVVLVAGFLFGGGPILSLAFGDYYSEGATILILLSIGQLINAWVGASGTVLMMAEHQVVAMTIALASALAMVVAGLIVVGPYGATGVAAANAAGVGLCNIAFWLWTKWRTNIWTHADFSSLPSSLGVLVNLAKK